MTKSADASLRDAATVILLRPIKGGSRHFDVFMVKRPSRSRFMPGAYVFPGGRSEVGDASIEATAIRETHEESSVRLNVEELVMWSRWVTPEVEPRRYDARFFLAQVDVGTEAVADPVETVGGEWVTPTVMLERAAAGEVFLAPPTQRCLELLNSELSSEEVIAAARQAPTPMISPVVILDEDPPFVALPGDPRHPDPEKRIAGATRIPISAAWLQTIRGRNDRI